MPQTLTPVPSTFYNVLVANRAYLKGISLASDDAQGITQSDLDRAEQIAYEWIHGRLAEMFDVSDWTTTTPPDVRRAAELHSSARVWEWWRQRNDDEEAGLSPNVLDKRAEAVVADIERAGRVVLSDDTVQEMATDGARLPLTVEPVDTGYRDESFDSFVQGNRP